MELADRKSPENQAKKKKRVAKNTVIEAQPLAEVPEKLNKKTRIEETSLVTVISAKPTNSCSIDDSGIQVSMFDYSSENHFTAMDEIFELCGQTEADLGGFDEEEIERLSSTVTFLSEWTYFNAKPKTIRFVPESGFSDEKEAHNDVTLSQFSAARVPKSDLEAEHAVVSTDSRKDFVLYIGGLVWALDWCPRPEQGTHSDTKCEFIAVSAHPPDSPYHKLGEPLSGRGMIQIWCLISCSSSSVNLQAPAGKTKKKYEKKSVAHKEDTPKRPRGRPRKNPVDKSLAFASPEICQALVQLPENTSDVLPVEANIVNTQKNSEADAAIKKENKPKKPRGRPGNISIDTALAVVGTEGQLTQALVVHPSGEQTVSIPLLDENKLSIPASQKEKRKKLKDAMDNAPAAMDTESQFSQAFVVVTSEDTSNVPVVDKNLLVTPALAVVGVKKGKKQKGVKKGKNAMDRTPLNEDQFTQAIVVHISNVPPMDGNILNTPAVKKEKRGKQKTVTTIKNAMGEIAGALDPEEPCFQALAVEFPENMANISPMQETNTLASHEKNGKRQRVPTRKVLNADLEYTISELRRKRPSGKSKVHNEPGHDNRLDQNDGEGPSLAGQQENCMQKEVNVLEHDAPGEDVFNVATGSCNAPKNIVLPRVVLCLGHDGKVAWDVKWRPHNTSESVKHIMGHLAVALGNGSVEVWEIPSPQIIQCIYASQHADNIDPRFAKLKPVFSSAQLKCGDKQSVPLTVEWSTSPPHDLILAGCHDGMVALWKFCADSSSQDVRPLLCFRAETDPIRAISWAPHQGDPVSAKVIVTAGHGGLKFWDLRDPFRPLWDANPSQRFIYSLDWLPDPRCVLVSYDDGTIRMVSLARAACDDPVTGEPFTGTLQQGVNSYCCSSFSIWSIHVSRLTGVVAYCCADGTVLYFQLTHKAVDKDPLRNRAPHFLCGSLVDEESALAINTYLPTYPHLMKKSATEWANTPRPSRTVASSLNQVKRVRKGTEKNQKPDDGIFALPCDEEHTKGDANEAHISSPSEKGKAGKSKKANDENVNGRSDVKEEVQCEFEVPPSKIVSMYKVRWNMNKGSEKWLCYGGAAGIVRCQEIDAPVYDKKLLRRVPS